MARMAALSTLLILGLAGCGGNDETPEIRSFEIALLSPSVARVSYDLTDPARLRLDIRGVNGGVDFPRFSGHLTAWGPRAPERSASATIETAVPGRVSG
jgi:hypothetical protein